ncbi:sigma factor [Paenarthrobacter sp. NPDC056912]|uniref:sigma factor n=1 Tax=Paenarthrobacter sp. NPDC056912 TaxID=3345965 RepID=UPI0036730642
MEVDTVQRRPGRDFLVENDDERLIKRVREGDSKAFGVLYGRYLEPAKRVAAGHLDNASDIDDVVADSFTAVLQRLHAGHGPEAIFRGYLLRIVRRMAHARNLAASRSIVTSERHILDTASFDEDTVLAEFENNAVTTAFRSLPRRWQAVLWYVNVKGLKPSVASDLLGLGPNATSALALRAREGLRRAYLQSHVTSSLDEGCEPYLGLLGAYARNGVKRSSREKVETHLRGCSQCAAALMQLRDIQGAMRAVPMPGWPFTSTMPECGAFIDAVPPSHP